MTSQTPQDLPEAKRLAKRHGMHLIERPTSKGTDYLLYRDGYPRGTLIGKRSNVHDIASLVGKCAVSQI